MSNQKLFRKRKIIHKLLTQKVKRRKAMKPNQRSPKQPTNIIHKSLKPILSNKTPNQP